MRDFFFGVAYLVVGWVAVRVLDKWWNGDFGLFGFEDTMEGVIQLYFFNTLFCICLQSFYNSP